jgi:hypothetical protein
MKHARRILATGLAAAACAAAVGTAGTSREGELGYETVAAAQPGSLVEDFSYPGAEKIKAEKGITLKSGDGHIVLADCDGSPGQMEIHARGRVTTCFRVIGSSGYLSVEIPAVFGVKASADEAADVTLTAPDSTVQEVHIPKGAARPVGETADPQARDHTLVEIRVGEETSPPPLIADPARPWLARVNVDTPGRNGSRSCSGALVDQTWVLTSASCFPDGAAGTLNATATVAGQNAIKINYLVPRSDRDLVLVRLATPITNVALAPLTNTAPADGSALVAAGTGRSKTEWVPNTPHSSSVTQSSAAATNVSLTAGQVCQGDAGGPVLDSSGRITAVLSTAEQGECFGQVSQGTSATAARVDNIVPWLKESTLTPLARYDLDEAAGSRRVSGGATENFAVRLGGGAELGAAGKTGTALRLNGTSAYAATSGPVVDATKSFTVSAWVKLDKKDKNYTFLSQAGTRASAFQVYYSKYYDKFVFNRHVKDTDDTDIARAMSKQVAQTGVWTHLAGSYDADAQTISLFVNGALQEAAKFTTYWRANGGFQVGRLWYKGAWQEYMPGQIDDIRTFQSPVTAANAASLASGSSPAELQELASFPLNEPSGSETASGGSGAGLTATLAGGAQLGAAGKTGTALRLNGTSGYAATSARMLSTVKSFSVSAWVKLDKKDKNYTFLSQAGSRGSGFQLYYSKDYDKFVFNRHAKDADDTGIVRSVSTDVAQVGVWTQLTGVYDATTNKIQLFVNGKPQTAADFTTPWAASSALQIGRVYYKGVWQENLAGSIDDVRIWDRAVGASEISNQGLRINN